MWMGKGGCGYVWLRVSYANILGPKVCADGTIDGRNTAALDAMDLASNTIAIMLTNNGNTLWAFANGQYVTSYQYTHDPLPSGPIFFSLGASIELLYTIRI